MPGFGITGGNAFVNIGSINGRQPGSLFGDDFSVTYRSPFKAFKWSQGINPGDFTLTNGTNGYFQIVEDVNDASLFDGVAEIGIEDGGTVDEQMIFSSNQPNRYIPGHLSFFGGTFSWHYDTANGDFEMLVGALHRGPVSIGRSDEIKDAILWGLKREGGVDKWVFRVIKNYVKQSDDEFTPNFTPEILSIFEQRVGYYGIHPAQVSVVKAVQDFRSSNQSVYEKIFSQAVTSISDPNLNWGIYIKNNGNTGKLAIRNGSIEFGNYFTVFQDNDPSGRDISHQVSISSLAVTANDQTPSVNGVVAAYTVKDIVSMVSRIDSSGNTFSDFVNTISNRLFTLTASGQVLANRPVFLNIYLLEKDAVTLVGGQDFVQINPGVNVLYYASAAKISSVDFSRQVDSRISVQIDTTPREFDLAGRGQDLLSDYVALITLNSNAATTVNNFLMTIDTTDLF